MLRQLIRECREATTLTEQIRLLTEIVAYKMQTSPRGKRFYYTGNKTKTGRWVKVYRELGGKGGKARKKERLAGETYKKAWKEAPIGGLSGRGEVIGEALEALFGNKAPSPKEFADMFSAQGIKADLEDTSARLGPPPKIITDYEVLDEDGRSIGTMTREFTKENGEPHVYHAYFKLRGEAQGGGRAGAMFGKAMETYKAMGVKSIGVTAGLDAGPYAWARFGFQPSESQMSRLRNEFEDFLTKVPIGLEPNQARALVQKHGKDIFSLSGTRVRVKQLDPKTGKNVTKTVKVGKDFLLHSSEGRPRGWEGKVNLQDPKAMGRWKRQAAKGRKQRQAAIEQGKQNDRLSYEEAQDLAEKRRVYASQYTSEGRRRFQRDQAQARAERRRRQEEALSRQVRRSVEKAIFL